LYVSPDSALRYARPGEAGFDRDLLQIADRYIDRESVVWDIGANFGLFSFLCAARATEGLVLAVEPDPFLTALMRRSLRLPANRGLPISVLPLAISDRVGVTRLQIAEHGRNANTIAEAHVGTVRGSVREECLVPTFRLDSLLEHFAAPTFLKIDVEGAEELVLAGAEAVIQSRRPVVYIEVPKWAKEAISGALRRWGYLPFDGERDPSCEVPLTGCVWNTLARPAEVARP
jgi:FkbM family methyltransferase